MLPLYHADPIGQRLRNLPYVQDGIPIGGRVPIRGVSDPVIYCGNGVIYVRTGVMVSGIPELPHALLRQYHKSIVRNITGTPPRGWEYYRGTTFLYFKGRLIGVDSDFVWDDDPSKRGYNFIVRSCSVNDFVFTDLVLAERMVRMYPTLYVFGDLVFCISREEEFTEASTFPFTVAWVSSDGVSWVPISIPRLPTYITKFILRIKPMMRILGEYVILTEFRPQEVVPGPGITTAELHNWYHPRGMYFSSDGYVWDYRIYPTEASTKGLYAEGVVEFKDVYINVNNLSWKPRNDFGSWKVSKPKTYFQQDDFTNPTHLQHGELNGYYFMFHAPYAVASPYQIQGFRTVDGVEWEELPIKGFKGMYQYPYKMFFTGDCIVLLLQRGSHGEVYVSLNGVNWSLLNGPDELKGQGWSILFMAAGGGKSFAVNNSKDMVVYPTELGVGVPDASFTSVDSELIPNYVRVA